MITRAPTDDFSGRFSASYADPDNYQTVAGSLSGPLIEGVLRGRIAASYHAHDGFSKNVLAGGDARPLENQSVNGTLVWDAPQNAELTFNAYWEEVTGQQTAYSSPAGPTDYVDDVALNFNSVATYTYSGGNLKGVFDVADNTQMTAILAYDYRTGQASGDGDFGPVPFIRVTDGHNTLDTYTGEVRFDTAVERPAQHADRRVRQRTRRQTYSCRTSSPCRRVCCRHCRRPSISPRRRQSRSPRPRSRRFSPTLFFDITPSLEFTAGLRYDHQEVATTTSPTGYEANEWQPRVTLTQHLSDDHIIYASIARGFRGGGANPPAAPNPIYQGDSVWTFEIGDKFTTDDGTLTLNTALYYNDYKNYIGQNSLTPALIAVNLNTGDVTSYGLEVEGAWRPTEAFAVQGGLTYNHARITDDSQYAAIIGHGLPTDLILFQPDWNLFLSPSLTIPVGSGDAAPQLDRDL